jgi:hypothetical protein
VKKGRDGDASGDVFGQHVQFGQCGDQALPAGGFEAAGPLRPQSCGKWTMGTRVRHAKFGNGTILRTEGDGDDMKLTISFMTHGLKKMIAKYAEWNCVKLPLARKSVLTADYADVADYTDRSVQSATSA